MRMLFFSNKADFQLVKRVYAYRSKWEIDLETQLETLHNSKNADSLDKYENLFKEWFSKNKNSGITIKKVPKCRYFGDPNIYEWKLNIFKGKRLIFSISEPFKKKK